MLSHLCLATAALALVWRKQQQQKLQEHQHHPVSHEHTTIRKAQPKDIVSILSIYSTHANDPYSIVTFEEQAPTQNEMEKRRQKVLANGDPYFVAVCNSDIVGFAYCHPFRERTAYRFATELSVYVAKNGQGRGVGKKLMLALIQHCQLHEKKSMIAVLGSEKLQTFYHQFGFQTVGCLHSVGYKPKVGQIDRWIMELLL